MDKRELQAAFEAAKRVREHAYAPYSGFKVGAALIAADGEIYTGCNVENASYGATICAERNTVIHAVAVGDLRSCRAIVIVADSDPPAPPCALCLQVLTEFCSAELQVHLADTRQITASYTLGELLPHPFNRESLTEHAHTKPV